jgi:hypothetical protein
MARQQVKIQYELNGKNQLYTVPDNITMAEALNKINETSGVRFNGIWLQEDTKRGSKIFYL